MGASVFAGVLTAFFVSMSTAVQHVWDVHVLYMYSGNCPAQLSVYLAFLRDMVKHAVRQLLTP